MGLIVTAIEIVEDKTDSGMAALEVWRSWWGCCWHLGYKVGLEFIYDLNVGDDFSEIESGGVGGGLFEEVGRNWQQWYMGIMGK